MGELNNIITFFNELRLNAGAIWLVDGKIKFSAPKRFQNQETDTFIIANKSKIISILEENFITTDKAFLSTVILKDSANTFYPLSPAQERLWFIEQYEQGTNAYNLPLAFELDPDADKSAIKYALQQIINRHEILRSTIEQDDQAGHGIQLIHDTPLLMEEIYASTQEELDAFIKRDIDRPFNLGKEYPIHVKFYTIGANKFENRILSNRTILLITIHHIATDGWSMDIFQNELHAYYYACIKKDLDFKLPSLKIQYKDYARWQKSYLTDDTIKRQLDYWKNKLIDYQTLEFPTDFVRPDKTTYEGSYIDFLIDKEVSRKLRNLAQHLGVTLNSVMLASINILLSKYTRQDDIVIGCDTANRHYKQTEDLIGFFVNTQVNRTLLSKDQTFEDLILQVHADQTEAQLNQDLPFEKLVDELKIERDLSRHPIFQVMFGMQNFNHQRANANLEKGFITPYHAQMDVELFDLSIYINDSQEGFEGMVSYATSLYCKATIQRFIQHYTHLLHILSEQVTMPYSSVSLLGKSEHDQLRLWNNTEVAYPSEKTFVSLFEEKVSIRGSETAIICEGMKLSYNELNEKSNQLAHHLRATYETRTGKTLQTDMLITICMERSLEIVVGILAVWKAGCAYVPIDPSYPQDRIDYVLADTNSALILIKKGEIDSIIALPKEQVLAIDLTEEFYKSEDRTNPDLTISPSDLAYIIYTSGSTGKPKGAMIEHAGMLNHLYAKVNLLQLTQESIVAQNASQSFDISVWQFFAGLLSGGQVIVYIGDLILNPAAFLERLLTDRTTILEVVPSYLSAMLDELEKQNKPYLNHVFYLLVTGEELKSDLVKRWFSVYPQKYLVNAYGPTEASDDITHHVMNDWEYAKFIPIGKPVQNLKLYIVDQAMQLCPIGVSGEICVSGIGVGRGYLNNVSKTREVFMDDPFTSDKGIRLYKTGDIGKWLSDGSIQYLGRKDEQIKIRGYRIELGEIEHTLGQMDGVKQACVLVKERKTENSVTKYLVAYYIGDKTQTTADIQVKLSGLLPEFMVPSLLVEIDNFPLTANGKLDKKALPNPDFTSSLEHVEPKTELESLLCKIWREILNIDKISVTDNFFRIGGDSILSIQVSSRIRQAGYSCQVKDIFECKTISKLALRLSGEPANFTLKTEQGVLSGEVDFLPIQQFFISQVNHSFYKAPNHYNQSFLIKVPVLDVKKLENVVQELVSYHDVLRIRYTREGLNWKQFYESHIVCSAINQLDVSMCNSLQMEEILTAWQSDFNIEKGELFKVGYLHGYADGSARIYFALHHLIVDAVSWRILADGIKQLYHRKPLAKKGSSYRQWVESVKAYTITHASELSYWQTQLKDMPVYSKLAAKENCITSIELDKVLTRKLLQEASKAYHTEINDLLLTALAYALKELNNSTIQGITLEGHGRESIDPGIDHSHTLGWYTSMYPVKLVLRETLKESIQSIKEYLRSIPNKGIGFGAFACSNNSDYGFNNLVPISFNYLGQFDAQESDWQIVAENSGKSIHETNEDHYIIDMNGFVDKGILEFTIVSKLGTVLTEQFGERFKTELTRIIDHCIEQISMEETSHTPSDFGLVRISQSLLDKLQLKAKNI